MSSRPNSEIEKMFALEHRGFTMQKKKQEVDYHMTHPNPLAESTVKADVCRREPFRKKPSGPRAFVRFC